jgi:BirA family biotin operon repressor/biotin-[acetyl-CoA-carboxylase] ligase
VLLPQPGTGDPRKVGGILVEARPREAWAVVGIGLNVAVRVAELPPELAGSAGTLGLERSAIEPLLERLLATLEHWLARSPSEVLDAWRARDALLGRPLRWDGGTGVGRGVDDKGHLLVDSGTARHVLDAGEVHLGA